MVCTSLGSLLRPLFYFLDDVSYPQSVQKYLKYDTSETESYLQYKPDKAR